MPRRPAPSPEGPQQHDLDPVVADRLVAGVRLRPGERVLDAGAGLGAISAALLEAEAKVTAIELDPERVSALRERFADAIADGRIEVFQGDLRRWHPQFRDSWRVVANPPFNLTADLIRGWLLDRDPPHALDLVLQHETAEKLCRAPAGGHTRSSAFLACAGEATFVARLPREATTPPSRVNLAVWRFRRAIDGPAAADLVAIDRLLAIAFAGPHTVADALRGVASAIQLKRQGAEHGWDPRVHPRDVPPRAWLPLARLLAMCGKLGR